MYAQHQSFNLFWGVIEFDQCVFGVCVFWGVMFFECLCFLPRYESHTMNFK
jgi:hypothetical protein